MRSEIDSVIHTLNLLEYLYTSHCVYKDSFLYDEKECCNKMIKEVTDFFRKHYNTNEVNRDLDILNTLFDDGMVADLTSSFKYLRQYLNKLKVELEME